LRKLPFEAVSSSILILSWTPL